ncbi:MAG: mechanosensitive ion channel [Sumerlaeia bacterium]
MQTTPTLNTLTPTATPIPSPTPTDRPLDQAELQALIDRALQEAQTRRADDAVPSNLDEQFAFFQQRLDQMQATLAEPAAVVPVQPPLEEISFIDRIVPPESKVGQFFEYIDRFGLFGTPLSNWLVFIALFLLVFFALWFLLRVFKKRAERASVESGPKMDLSDYVLKMLDRVKIYGLVGLALFIASRFDLLGRSHLTFQRISIALVFFQFAMMLMAVLDQAIEQTLKAARFRVEAVQTASGVLRFFALVTLWSLILLLIFDNFGVEVGPLIAGLGVGGIAIAFALQKILGDIFCSVAIVLDRPFEVGDFIITGDHLGSVERIGIKTTRVRSLGGEQIIFPNSNLLDSRIRNYKRMRERRVVFAFGVLYATPPEKLEKIPLMVKEIVQGVEQTRFDRAHFQKFGDFSLDFEVVYYVLSPDFNIYMDIQQKINLGIFRGLTAEGVGFAFPSRTIYVEGTDVPLSVKNLQ